MIHTSPPASEGGISQCGRMYQSGTSSIAHQVETLVVLDGTVYCLFDGMEDQDNDRINISVDGIYYVAGGCEYYSGVLDAKRFEVRIKKNASTKIDDNSKYSGSAAESVRIRCGNVHILSAGDYLRLYAYHTNGVNVTLDNERYSTFLYAMLLQKT